MGRIFYDTEFLEDGNTIALISIGIVAEDGREYYAVNRDAPWRRIRDHEWLMENVVPSLPITTNKADGRLVFDEGDSVNPLLRPHSVIADEVLEFLLAGGRPELWGYFSAYDHVALCQLWGRMIDLPDGVPMFTNDIKQECERLGNPTLPEQGPGEHNALSDARWNRDMFRFLTNFERDAIAQLRMVR